MIDISKISHYVAKHDGMELGIVAKTYITLQEHEA